MHRLDLVTDPIQHSITDAVFSAEILKEGFNSLLNRLWPTDTVTEKVLSDVLEVTFVERRAWSTTFIGIASNLAGSAMALITHDTSEQNVAVRIAGTYDAAAQKDTAVDLYEKLLEKLPVAERSGDAFVRFTFWARTPHGPNSWSRRIVVPEWDKIEANYATKTSEQIGEIMRIDTPGRGGQLLLWHGVPGTGKTYAIRALSRQWKDWADFHYICDPERFFGEADYMLGVLLNEADGDPGGKDKPRWRVLVLEDVAELVQTDSREKVGQSLSRLLNVVDGLIGQGLRVLVLITTNEDFTHLHPAVARPGRCAANVRFDPLVRWRCEQWAKRHGVGLEGSEYTLAELYAALAGQRMPAKVGVGF